MEEESNYDIAPSCPYCQSNELDCDHILLHFDLTFEEAVSGYLLITDIVLETIKEIIYNDFVNHKQTMFHSKNLKAMYEWAAENLQDGDALEDLQIDLTAYYHYLEDDTSAFGTETETYSVEGGRGMSSVYSIIFCKDPGLAAKKIVNEIYAGNV